MRKSWGKKISIFILLLFLFAGCGQQENSDLSVIDNSESGAGNVANAEQSIPGEDWQVQFAEIELRLNESYFDFARTEGKLYAITYAMNQQEEYPLPYLTDEKLWNGTKQYFDTQQVPMTVGHQPRCMVSDGEETLYLLVQNHDEDESSYFLYTITADGEVWQSDITESFQETFAEEQVTTMAVDAEGRIYLGAFWGQDKLLILETDGTFSAVVDLQEFDIYDMAVSEGKVYCVGMAHNTDKLFVVNDIERQLEPVMDLPASQGCLMLNAGTGGKLLYGYYDGIYEINVENGEGQDIYLWNLVGVTGRDVSEFLADSQGNICVVPKAQKSDNSMELILLQNPATPAIQNAKDTNTEGMASATSEPIVKEEIVLAGDPTNQVLARMVGEFNVRNPKYKVVIKNCDYDLLLTQIITGNGPDLIPTSAIGAQILAQKGVAEDLASYLAESEILSKDMLNEKVLELATVGGKLISLPNAFSISTLYGKASELGSESGWTVEEFLAYVNQNRGKTIMEGSMVGDSREILMHMIWHARQEHWIDWEQGKAHFDSVEFKNLLEFAVNYQSKYDEAYDVPNRDSTENRWQDGKILLFSQTITCMNYYLWHKEIMEGDIVPIGYPTEDGSPCHLMQFSYEYSINSMSEHKEGAWAFIEYLVASQTWEERGSSIPTLKSEMEAMLMESTEEKNRNIGGYDIPAATEEDVALFRELLENVTLGDYRSMEVNSILTEELQTCIYQGRSVDETIDIIQNRMQLYLDEM